AEAILYEETLSELRLEAANCRDALRAAKAVIESEVEEFNETQADTRKMVLEEAPEVADELARISRLEKELACLRLARNVTERSAIVRLSLGAADFARFLDNYSALLRLPDGFEEFPAEFREKYATRMTALKQEFFRELKAALSAHLLQMHFPFDKSIDYSSMKAPLQQAVTILRCIHAVSEKLEDARTGHLELELLFAEFSKRFHFHFYGERPTNSPAKPEWFFTQLSLWAANHVEFFDLHIQPLVDEVMENLIISIKEVISTKVQPA
ncbi:RAD50-interacting protein 1-like protein, partial [Aphelenchoides avenae]